MVFGVHQIVEKLRVQQQLLHIASIHLTKMFDLAD